MKGSTTTHIAIPNAGAALERLIARRDVPVPVMGHLSAHTVNLQMAQEIIMPALQRDPEHPARTSAA